MTFAFVDVVGSTRTFAEYGDRYVAAVRRLHETVERCVERHGGVVVEVEGDGAFLAFPGATAACAGLVEVQLALEQAQEEPHLRVRAGAHTGDAHPIGNGYLALPVHVAARVASTANATTWTEGVLTPGSAPRERRLRCGC